mmetsp:Transcript_116639/g.316758  ORF Transcript_116639/g.316758 Transcript_116639/m.316758 type:complete len:154 (-) Transcript_116639:418-879(-)
MLAARLTASLPAAGAFAGLGQSQSAGADLAPQPARTMRGRQHSCSRCRGAWGRRRDVGAAACWRRGNWGARGISGHEAAAPAQPRSLVSQVEVRVAPWLPRLASRTVLADCRDELVALDGALDPTADRHRSNPRSIFDGGFPAFQLSRKATSL